jgi:hypothetical protein
MCAVVMGATMPSSAGEPEPEEGEPSAAEEEEPGWSIAAGMRADPGLGQGLLGGMAALGPTFLVERRLTDTVWIAARVHGGFGIAQQWSEQGSGELVYGVAEEVTSKSLGGALGIRWVITPGEVLELSALLLAEAGWGGSRAVQGPATWESDATQAGGNFGLGLDRELVPGLGLRLDLEIVEAGFLRVRSTYTEADRTNGNGHHGWYGGFALRPTFALRYSF